MRKIWLIAMLLVAAGWLGGCSVAYEEYRCHPHRSRVVVAPPPVEVVEVITVPARRPKPRHRRYWPSQPHPWR